MQVVEPDLTALNLLRLHRLRNGIDFLLLGYLTAHCAGYDDALFGWFSLPSRMPPEKHPPIARSGLNRPAALRLRLLITEWKPVYFTSHHPRIFHLGLAHTSFRTVHAMRMCRCLRPPHNAESAEQLLVTSERDLKSHFLNMPYMQHIRECNLREYC